MILHLCSVHSSVEVVEVFVLEVRIIDKVPLSTRVVVAVTVAFAGKVQPFRVPELIACIHQQIQYGVCNKTQNYQ